MKNNNILFIFLLFLISLMYSCSTTKIPTKVSNTNNLLGSWEMQSFYWISQDTTYARENVHPGIFLFTNKSYSIQWIPTSKGRKKFENLSKPTDEEMIAGFKSVVFNSGSYVSSEDTVVATAYIAKVPGFEGGKQFYNYDIKGDILSLTMYDETYPDGTKPDWVGKWKTKFVLKRIQ